MSDNQAFDLISTGKVCDGFDQEQVMQSFQELFNCSEAKARAYTTTKKVVRKEIDKDTGMSYGKTLKSIGLDVRLVPRKPPEAEPPAANGELSLAPVEDETESGDEDSADVLSSDNTADEENPATAAKPAEAAALGATAAVGAAANEGMVISRANAVRAGEATNATGVANRPPRKEVPDDIDDIDDDENLFVKALIGPAAAAVVGMLIWAAVIVGLEKEHAIIAAIVGGVVGAGAKLTDYTGSSGRGVVCAVMVFLAICGGKWFGYSWYLDPAKEAAAAYLDELNSEELLQLSTDYADMMQAEAIALSKMEHTDVNIRAFMMENDYYYDHMENGGFPTRAEIDEFKEYTMPEIMSYLDYNGEDLSEDYQSIASFENFSVWEAIKADLGLLDLLFLFFGIGAAYRMAFDDEE